jgi:hypothetical protein
LPIFQASHHGAYPPRLFVRGNHRIPVKTTIFCASASIKYAAAAPFAARLFHRNSKHLQRAETGHNGAYATRPCRGDFCTACRL